MNKRNISGRDTGGGMWTSFRTYAVHTVSAVRSITTENVVRKLWGTLIIILQCKESIQTKKLNFPTSIIQPPQKQYISQASLQGISLSSWLKKLYQVSSPATPAFPERRFADRGGSRGRGPQGVRTLSLSCSTIASRVKTSQ